MTSIAIPDRYRQLALQTNTDKPVMVVARALWRYETDLQTMVDDIAADAGTTQTTVNRWARKVGLKSRRVLSYEQYAEQAGALYDSYGNLTAVSRDLGVNTRTVKRAIVSTGRTVNDQPAAIREALSPIYAADSGWLSIREAAALTGIGRSTLSHRCHDGLVDGAKFVPVRPGATKKRWLIPQRWADQRATGSVPTAAGRRTYLHVRPLAEWIALQPFEQVELSAQSGVPERRIYEVRHGINTYIELGTADRLIHALGATLDDVWDDPDADMEAATAEFKQHLRDGLARGQATQRAQREAAAA